MPNIPLGRARSGLSARNRKITWCWNGTRIIFVHPPKIAKIRFRVVPEAIVRALELRKGTADLELTSLTPDMVPVLRSEPGIEVTATAGNQF